MEVIDDKIKSYWDWFIKNISQINPQTITKDMINLLDSNILELGDFAWEIREGINKANMLIISPGGDIDLLSQTKKIIEKAPETPDWEFEYFKPAKKWDYSFSLHGVKGEINASNWEYVLLKFSDGTFDVLIKADNINFLDENDKNIAVDIVLESILGEEPYLTYITNYEIVSTFEGKYEGKENKITVLSNHFKQSLS